MLLRYKIKPILVFDGQRLPAKEQTEIKRRKYVQRNKLFKYYEVKKLSFIPKIALSSMKLKLVNSELNK